MGSHEYRCSSRCSRNVSRSIEFRGVLTLLAQADRICADGCRRSSAWTAGFASVCLQASLQPIREPAKRFPVCQKMSHQELKYCTQVHARLDRQNTPPHTAREPCVSLQCAMILARQLSHNPTNDRTLPVFRPHFAPLPSF